MAAQHITGVRPTISLCFLLILAGFGPGLGLGRAQSLADVARKEEARRKTVPEAAKVYTNKDLHSQPTDSPPAAPAPDKTGDAAKDPDQAGKGAKDGKDAKDAKDGKEPVKDRAYWFGQMKKLQEQVDRDETYSQAIQTRINSLTADFVNRDDPAQRAVIERDRQKALAELGRLKQSITDGKKAIVDLEEEARRAGVPPGWLR